MRNIFDSDTSWWKISSSSLHFWIICLSEWFLNSYFMLLLLRLLLISEVSLASSMRTSKSLVIFSLFKYHLKSVDLFEYSNIASFFQNFTAQVNKWEIHLCDLRLCLARVFLQAQSLNLCCLLILIPCFLYFL